MASALENGVSALLKKFLKKPFFILKKLKISCSLNRTILFKFH